MKTPLFVISLFFALNLNAQSNLKIDEQFLGIFANTAISGQDLDGRDIYSIPFDEWLEMKSKTSEEILTYNDFENKSDKFKNAINNSKSKNDTIGIKNIILKQVLIHDIPFEFKIIDFDKYGNFRSVKFMYNMPTQENDKKSAIIQFGSVVNILKELYGECSNLDSLKNERTFIWEGKVMRLTATADFNSYLIKLSYSKI